VQFFHEGRGSPAVDIFVDDARLPFDPGRSTYPSGSDPERLRAGDAGLRLHAPFKRPDYPDEFVVFQGASYFRAVGRDESYGLSARPLAIDMGGKNGEEFPAVTAIHLVRPERGDKSLHLVAAVRSERAEAAFHFEAMAGEPTTMDGSWRTAFQVRPSANDVELRGFLHAGDRAASEALAYLWQPGKEVAAR
jgi:glucan biosynthesis protein